MYSFLSESFSEGILLIECSVFTSAARSRGAEEGEKKKKGTQPPAGLVAKWRESTANECVQMVQSGRRLRGDRGSNIRRFQSRSQLESIKCVKMGVKVGFVVI